MESQDSSEDHFQCLDGHDILIFLEDFFFESLRSQNIMVHLGQSISRNSPQHVLATLSSGRFVLLLFHSAQDTCAFSGGDARHERSHF